MADTPTSLMVILTVVDFEPAELLAQMVKTAPASTTLGVPEMVPLLLSKLRPEGSVALISHEVTLPDVLTFGEGWRYRGDCTAFGCCDVRITDVTWSTRDVEGERALRRGTEGCPRHCKRGVSDGFSGRT